MNQAVIFFCFANDQTDHLLLLKEESRRIKEELRPLEVKNLIRLEREESATSQDLIATFSQLGNDIVIFHYAGHASGSSLLLESGEAYAKGLAQLLGQLPKLQLVFMNGCSTQGQVKELLDQGVKVVLATSVAVNDKKAMEFSAVFFKALAQHKSLLESFQLAKGAIQLQYQNPADIDVVSVRSAGFMNKELPDSTPWGIYVLKENEANLEWKIPTAQINTNLQKDNFNLIDEGLKSQAALFGKRLNRIREALALEDDPSRQLKYEMQIERIEKQLKDLMKK